MSDDLRSLQRQLGELTARAAIAEALARYCRGLDRSDTEVMKSAWHADAVYEHAGSHHMNAHDLCDMAAAFLGGLGPCTQMMGQPQSYRWS